MASLIGKADPSLVTAAARAGLANVPGDYSKQFGIMADANKDLLTGVATAFKQYETDKKASKKELEDAMKDLRTYGVGIENNADYNMFSDEMDAQVAIWKENGGFQNDSKGLREWERQNNKIMGKYKSNQTSLIEAIEKFEASDSWIDGLEPGDSKFLTSLTKYAKNVDDKSGTHNAKANDYMANNTGADTDKTPEQLWKHLVVLGAKEGEMVKYLDPATNEFSYITSINGKVVSKKSSEISEMIPTKAITTETTIQGRLNDIAKNPTGTYTANDSLMNQNWLERVIDQAVENGESLQYLMNQKYGGMKESFADSLRNGTAAITPAIIQSLSDLGYTIEDQAKGEKGHGVLDKNDFMIGTNYNTIVDEILNGEDTYELRRDLFIDKLDNEVFRHEAEQVSKKTDVDFYKNKVQKLDGSDWNGSSAESVYKDILAGTTFTEKDPDTKKINVYSYHDGSWYQNWKQGDTPKTKESYIGSADDLGRIFTNDSRFRNIKTAAAKQQGETQEIETENKVVNGVEIKVPKKKEGIVSNKPKPRTPSTASVIEASDLEGITKEKSKAGITIYYNYEGNDIDAAKKALSQAKGTTGIDDPFISYWIGDKGIGIREYENLKDKSNVTFKVQIGVDKTPPPLQDLKVEGQEPLSEPVVPSDTTIITPSDTTITEPPAIEDVDQDYGSDNPDPMFGKINMSGDRMMGSDGEWVKIDSRKYFKDLGIKSRKGKTFIKGEGVMEKVYDIADGHGFNVKQLLDVFRNESNFDTRGRNPKGGATGLIQFFKDQGKSYKTINGVKYELDDIKEMSVLEQLDLVDEYFTEMHTKGEHPYTTVALPAIHKKGMDEIYATSDSAGYPGKVWRDNKPWRDENGNITKRSIIAYGTKSA